MNYISKQFTSSVRHVDMVFGLKATTRQKTGKGIRRQVEGQKKLECLREDDNKTELFLLISEQAMKEKFSSKVLIPHEVVWCSDSLNEGGLSPCIHEEANTDILRHAADGTKQCYKRILLRTVHTNVVILAVSSAKKLRGESRKLTFGMGKSFRYLDATIMAEILDDEKIKQCLARFPCPRQM